MTTTPELLLHQCCAPCSVGAVAALEKEFRINGFWFNPNIHPAEEYAKRKDSLLKYASGKNIYMIPDRGPAVTEEEWLNSAPDGREKRCEFCYTLRLERTAGVAKKLGIGRFSTTLLSSPFQKHELIAKIGREIAKNKSVEFVYRDMRNNYFEGKDSARKSGFYMQKYCGCLFSIQERKLKEPVP
jgi:predicted adenine nucleotide alpha hydrolase (AANH) superfamily ATPase